ncbi:hypothetical protein [Lyngbya aestuarii]|nr:hypothetical protein [Lyngbya aestuarii]
MINSNRHRLAMNLFIDSLHQHWCDRSDFFTGGNMFIYYSSEQARSRDFQEPDFFVVLNFDSAKRRSGAEQERQRAERLATRLQ